MNPDILCIECHTESKSLYVSTYLANKIHVFHVSRLFLSPETQYTAVQYYNTITYSPYHI